MEQQFLSIPEYSHEDSAEKSRRLSGSLTKHIWKESQETIASIYGVYARVSDGRIIKSREVSGSVPTREGRTLHHEKCGITFYFIDLILDWVNAFGYLDRLTTEEDSLFYFGLTVAAIIFPSFITHQGSATYGPRAGSGPPCEIVRPETY
ncbi:unnamed protein product [Clavelina lepadiformis]|uniref:Uncharacterized protein n=1 Tax=Clavelina lepadiformis TaxID=159417 RepID=A0ABP0H4W3_CLALP